MNSQYFDRLQHAFSHMASERDSSLSRSQEDIEKRQHLRDRFVVLRRDVIRNSMGALSTLLHNYKVQCQVVNDDNHTDNIGRKLYQAGVTLRVYKDSNAYDHLSRIPHFSVLWDEVNSVARFFQNNATRIAAGETTYVGKAEIHDLTSDLIDGKLFDFTNWLFQRSSSTPQTSLNSRTFQGGRGQ